MSDTEITPEVLGSLAAKVERLDLSEAERAVLDAVLERAATAEAEVEGFGVVFEIETTDHAVGTRYGDSFGHTGSKWQRALGWIGPDPGPGEK